MNSPHQTIILTVVGHRLSLPARLAGKRCADMANGMGGVARGRRAVLTVRPGEDGADLRQRLTDTITRLAGGASADADDIACRILGELQRTPLAGGGRRGWTLAPIQDGACDDDPYAPRLTRLTLVESPVRRRRVAFMRQRPALTDYKPHTQPTRRTHLVCLS